jgi:hypothetical protein
VYCFTLQAIDLIDEAGSRVRIAAYNARKDAATKEDPKVDEYLQVGLAFGGFSARTQFDPSGKLRTCTQAKM